VQRFLDLRSLRRVARHDPIAYRVPGKHNWDPKAMRFTNSAEATALLKPLTAKAGS